MFGLMLLHQERNRDSWPSSPIFCRSLVKQVTNRFHANLPVSTSSRMIHLHFIKSHKARFEYFMAALSTLTSVVKINQLTVLSELLALQKITLLLHESMDNYAINFKFLRVTVANFYCNVLFRFVHHN